MQAHSSSVGISTFTDVVDRWRLGRPRAPRRLRRARDDPESPASPPDGDGYLAIGACGKTDQLLEREALESAVFEIGGAWLVGADAAGHVALSRPPEEVDDRSGELLLERRDRISGIEHAMKIA